MFVRHPILISKLKDKCVVQHIKSIIQTNNINVFMRKAANVTEGLIRETNLYQFDHLAAAQGTWGPGIRVTLPREADLWTTISFLWLNI